MKYVVVIGRSSDTEGLACIIDVLLWFELIVEHGNHLSRFVHDVADTARQGTEKRRRHAERLADVATLVGQKLVVQLQIVAEGLVRVDVVARDAIDVGYFLQLGQGIVEGLGLDGAPRGVILCVQAASIGNRVSSTDTTYQDRGRGERERERGE